MFRTVELQDNLWYRRASFVKGWGAEMVLDKDSSSHAVESQNDASPVLEAWAKPEITSFLAAVEAQGAGTAAGEGTNNVS